MTQSSKTALRYGLTLSIVMILLVAFSGLPTDHPEGRQLNSVSFQQPPTQTPSLTPIPPPATQTASLTPTVTRTNTPTVTQTRTRTLTTAPSATALSAEATATNTPVTPFVISAPLYLTPAVLPTPTTLPPTGSSSLLIVAGIALAIILLGARLLRRSEPEP